MTDQNTARKIATSSVMASGTAYELWTDGTLRIAGEPVEWDIPTDPEFLDTYADRLDEEVRVMMAQEGF